MPLHPAVVPESYNIPEAFRYESHTPSGVVEGEFKSGNAENLSDVEVAYLELHAVPFGLAVRGTADAEKARLAAEAQEAAALAAQIDAEEAAKATTTTEENTK